MHPNSLASNSSCGSAKAGGAVSEMEAVLSGVASVAGSIHQAETVQGSHSLHLTISVCQRKTMADLLEIALPRALALAAEECTFMRQTLGANALNYLVRESNTSTHHLCLGSRLN